MLALTLAHAAEPLLTLGEFRQYAGRLAPRVNLFRDVWAADPTAEFFGGTSRDYLYWLKHQLLSGAATRADVERNMKRLMELPAIDVRDFIVGDSDVDLISERTSPPVQADKYGVKKIDLVDRKRLDPASDMGKTERDQGFIPMEKIRLARSGIVAWDSFGDGVKELWDGKLTVTFPDPAVFAETHYVKQGQNHQVLLALRFIRLAAMHYYYEHGRGYPDSVKLFATMSPETRDAVKRIIAEAVGDKKLIELVKNPRFADRLNDAVHKAFRTYTNPTAAFQLHRALGGLNLIKAYTQIKPVSQYLFARERDPALIAEHLREYGIDAAAFFTPRDKLLPDGKLYHGTKTEEAFRSILFTGILPSMGGSAGAGLYGAPEDNTKLAIEYAGGAADRVVTFDVKPDAKIVDLNSKAGDRIYKKFLADRPGATIEDFAEYFGIDILHYPYGSRAFVVKNSASISPPVGWKRQLMSFSRFCELAAEVSDKESFERLAKNLELNKLSDEEMLLILERSPYFVKRVTDLMKAFPTEGFTRELRELLTEAPILTKKVDWYFHAVARAAKTPDDLSRLLEAAHVVLKVDFASTDGKPGGAARLALEIIKASDGGVDHPALPLLFEKAVSFGDAVLFSTVAREWMGRKLTPEIQAGIVKLLEAAGRAGSTARSATIGAFCDPRLIEAPELVAAALRLLDAKGSSQQTEAFLRQLFSQPKARELPPSIADALMNACRHDRAILGVITEVFPTEGPGSLTLPLMLERLSPFLEGDGLTAAVMNLVKRPGGAEVDASRALLVAKVEALRKEPQYAHNKLRYATLASILAPTAASLKAVAVALDRGLHEKPRAQDAHSAQFVAKLAMGHLIDNDVEVALVKGSLIKSLGGESELLKELALRFLIKAKWADPDISAAVISQLHVADKSKPGEKVLHYPALQALVRGDGKDPAVAAALTRLLETGGLNYECMTVIVEGARKQEMKDARTTRAIRKLITEAIGRHPAFVHAGLDALFALDPASGESALAAALKEDKRVEKSWDRHYRASMLRTQLATSDNPRILDSLNRPPSTCEKALGFLGRNVGKLVLLAIPAGYAAWDGPSGFHSTYSAYRTVRIFFTPSGSPGLKKLQDEAKCEEAGGEWKAEPGKCLCPDGTYYSYSYAAKSCVEDAVERFFQDTRRNFEIHNNETSLKVRRSDDAAVRAAYDDWDHRQSKRAREFYKETEELTSNLRKRQDFGVYRELTDAKAHIESERKTFEAELAEIDRLASLRIDERKAACEIAGGRINDYYEPGSCRCPDGERLDPKKEGTCSERAIGNTRRSLAGLKSRVVELSPFDLSKRIERVKVALAELERAEQAGDKDRYRRASDADRLEFGIRTINRAFSDLGRLRSTAADTQNLSPNEAKKLSQDIDAQVLKIKKLLDSE